MSLRFVLDEHLRGPAWSAVRRHNATAESPLDVVRVGDPDCIPLGTDDPAILLWAELTQLKNPVKIIEEEPDKKIEINQNK